MLPIGHHSTALPSFSYPFPSVLPARLQEEFEACELPSKERREALAAELDIPSRSVQIWFQNRRQRIKLALTGGKRESPSDSVACGEEEDGETQEEKKAKKAKRKERRRKAEAGYARPP